MKKQITQIFLILIIGLVGFVSKAQTITIDRIKYVLNAEAGTAKVIGYDYGITNADIKSSVIDNGKDYTVTEIGNYAFSDCFGLTSVTIPNSVTTIGNSAFYYCSGLTSVTIPNSVTTIGVGPFRDCIKLKSIIVDINNSDYASVDGVLYDKDITVLIQYPGGLTSVIIPNSVTTIGDYAFANCRLLTSVTIPSSVTTIGNGAFNSCFSLTSVTIPNSVNTIGDYAFANCSDLTSVTIPNSVTTIGNGSFRSCYSLQSIIVDRDNPNYASVDGVLYDKDITVLIQCPYTMTLVIIPNSVTTIGDYAFANCSDLTSVTIPNSVITIGDYAFARCQGLTSVTIPNSVITIGQEAFFSCTALTSVTIPNSVTTIGNGAFSSCRGLTSVTIPNSVTTIGYGVFSDCLGLTEVYYGAEEPIECNFNIFSQEIYGSATLYVPEKAIDKCKEIDPWKNFEKIEAYVFSGIDEVSSDFGVNAPYEVFTISGVKVGNSLDGLPKGVYIVRQGSKSTKLVL